MLVVSRAGKRNVVRIAFNRFFITGRVFFEHILKHFIIHAWGDWGQYVLASQVPGMGFCFNENKRLVNMPGRSGQADEGSVQLTAALILDSACKARAAAAPPKECPIAAIFDKSSL